MAGGKLTAEEEKFDINKNADTLEAEGATETEE